MIPGSVTATVAQVSLSPLQIESASQTDHARNLASGIRRFRCWIAVIRPECNRVP
jgi:hypothetical protein